MPADNLAKAISLTRNEDPRLGGARRLEDGGKPEGEREAGLSDNEWTATSRKKPSCEAPCIFKRTFKRLIKPAIGSISIYDLRRVHVIKMLDTIADENGPVQADRALALIGKTTRDEHFYCANPPHDAQRYRRARPQKHLRLTDENRDLWAALDMFTGRLRPRPLFLPPGAARRQKCDERRLMAIR